MAVDSKGAVVAMVAVVFSASAAPIRETSRAWATRREA